MDKSYSQSKILKQNISISEKRAKYYKAWKDKNPEKVKEMHRKNNLQYRQRNKEKIKLYQTAYCRNRRWQDKKYRIDRNVSLAIYKSLYGAKNGRKWQSLVGYKTQELLKHLEKQFDDNMTWDNYGSYWEIDHIKPKSLFKYQNPEDEEFKKCWALDNLQPLEKTANRAKRDRIITNHTLTREVSEE